MEIKQGCKVHSEIHRLTLDNEHVKNGSSSYVPCASYSNNIILIIQNNCSRL